LCSGQTKPGGFPHVIATFLPYVDNFVAIVTLGRGIDAPCAKNKPPDDTGGLIFF
jgi:hypothetical protein